MALARALASDPEILFFDEPLSAIDYRLRKILESGDEGPPIGETGKTFIYITHSLEEAMVMSDRVAIMRAGRMVQIGPPLEIYQPTALALRRRVHGRGQHLSPSLARDGAVVLGELGVALPAG